ncbi:MAG: helix-turn-helix domain-containing protein [Candidatus Hydrogenedens sp.]|nr:helix-turn-helix domain-containing protein [Candidatus Hydrogenedens sp.]
MNLAVLGKRIRELRERRGLKQNDVANALQVSPQAVSKWERGENAPDISLWLGLSQLLGVSCDTLLGRTEAADTFPATVLCTGLNHFAERAKRGEPRDLALWANGLFHTVTETVLRHDGVPVKYVGDGFLGFFSGPRHADRALDAACDAKRVLDSADLVIALHSGDIYLGEIGHRDYARLDIVGDTVNTAFFAMHWIASHLQSGVGLTAEARKELESKPRLGKPQEAKIGPLDETVRIYEALYS